VEKGIFSLKGTTTLVTGASSGIGRRTAWLISELGGQVVITGRNEKRLGAAMERLEGEGHKAIAVELTDEGDRKKLVEECPPLNGVVHCAGVSRVAPIRYIKENVLRDIYAVNVEAPIHLTRDLVNAGQPQGGGSIVFVSSISGVYGWPGYVSYGSSKAALAGAARALAADLAPQKIRCNSVAPAMVRTKMIEGGYSRELLEKDEATYALGYGKPIDVAGTIAFFLSDASRWITGQCLVMDGGAMLQ
jgi:NAD(P)-dependent dehydrogenase (short-subunit alcohol dehydrogenase family)